GHDIGPPNDRGVYEGVGFSGWSALVVLIAAVTNTWSPHTTGELHPRPGISRFQATLCEASQVSGSAGSSAATPERSPRNCGQFSSAFAPSAFAPSVLRRDRSAFAPLRRDKPALRRDRSP